MTRRKKRSNPGTSDKEWHRNLFENGILKEDGSHIDTLQSLDPNGDALGPGKIKRKKRSKPEASGKEWDRIFFRNRNFKEDIPYIDSLETLDLNGDALDIFLQPYESLVPSCEIIEVQEFCRASCMDFEAAEAGKISYQGTDARIWLDDRDNSSKLARKHPKRMNALDLYKRLKQKVFASLILLVRSNL